MKRYLIIVALLLGTPASAQDIDYNRITCKLHGAVAYDIMGQRQYGMTHDEIMAKITNKSDFEVLADQAFLLPVLPAEADKTMVMEMFSDTVVNACMGEGV